MKNLMKTKRIRARVSWPSRKPEAKPAEEEDEAPYCCCASAGKSVSRMFGVLQAMKVSYFALPATLRGTW
jgi:hypothetical protein